MKLVESRGWTHTGFRTQSPHLPLIAVTMAIVITVVASLSAPAALIAGNVPTVTGQVWAAEVQYPAYRGYSNDFAGVMSSDQEARIDSLLRELERKTGIQGAVVTVKTISPMDSKGYAVGLFEDWGIGKKGQDNGFLVLLAIEERRVEIEVGYGLEPVLTDAICGQILDEFGVPYLRNGEYGEGMLSVARAIADRVSEADQGITGDRTVPPSDSRKQAPDLNFIIALIVFILIWYFARRSSKKSNSSNRRPPSNRGGGPFFPPPGGIGRPRGGSGGGFGGFGGGRSGGGGTGRGF